MPKFVKKIQTRVISWSSISEHRGDSDHFFLDVFFMRFFFWKIYTTIGIGGCSLGVDDTSITGKPYILQKICFQGLCSKFLGFWHGHGYFWPLRLLRLLEAKNGQNPSLEGSKSLKEWIFWNIYLIKIAHQPQKPLSRSNQIWARTSGKKDRGQCSKSWGCMIQQHSQNTILLLLSAENM